MNRRREVLLNALYNDLVIVVPQPAHHDYPHDPFHILYSHWKSTAVKRIYARICHLEFHLCRLLCVPGRVFQLQIHLHPQRRHLPPQHDSLLAFHPVHLVGPRPPPGRRKEQQLGRIGVGNIDHRVAGLRVLAVRTDGGAKLPGNDAVKLGEYANVFLCLDGPDLCGRDSEVVKETRGAHGP